MRVDGYLPVQDYAAIGDGRTVALVGRDGAIDWLCLPDLDSPSVFGALLDRERGGRFLLAPEAPFESTRRYLPGTNVLETTFATDAGTVRVTDAMTLPASGLAPYRELVRRVEGVAGAVPMGWCVEPRFGYAGRETRMSMRAGVPVAAAGRDAVAILAFDAGESECGASAVRGRFVANEGDTAEVVLAAAHQEPLVWPSRADVERRLAATGSEWRHWADSREYDGEWREAVVRSALALKLLVFAPSGAIAAAPTTSLPEEIGGERNWDYRFSWPRDAAFTLQALLALGCGREAHAFFSWLLHASQLTHPKIRVLYRLDGRPDADERTLELEGYRRSRPVRTGNAAAPQTQLDVYGELLEAARRFASHAGLDGDQARRLAEIADHVCACWERPDAGIWESRGEPAHFTQSKMLCAAGLDNALALAEEGAIPGASAGRWRRERGRIREFVETRCFSSTRGTYVKAAGDDRLDASLLLGVLAGYDEPRAPRLSATVDAVRRELGRGPLVHRSLGPDGLPGEEGAFVACSFWLAEAYARQGRLEEAVPLVEAMLPLANDVGLYAEEIDPETGAALGNFPQGLSHLALINAATAIAEARR